MLRPLSSQGGPAGPKWLWAWVRPDPTWICRRIERSPAPARMIRPTPLRLYRLRHRGLLSSHYGRWCNFSPHIPTFIENHRVVSRRGWRTQPCYSLSHFHSGVPEHFLRHTRRYTACTGDQPVPKFTVLSSAWFLAGGGVSRAGGRAYCVWRSGEGWVFIGLELQYDKGNSTYGEERG